MVVLQKLNNVCELQCKESLGISRKRVSKAKYLFNIFCFTEQNISVIVSHNIDPTSKDL